MRNIPNAIVGIFLVILVITIIVLLGIQRDERLQSNEEIRQDIAVNIATCIEDGDLPQYTVNQNGKLMQYLGCINP